MPLVLYSGDGPSRDGYDYDDKTGVSYEFPNRYLNRIVPGERFVYHQPSAYTGIGVVGPVSASTAPDRSVCEVLDWQPFEPTLALKDEDGYFEVDPGATTSVYWAQGVRRISEVGYERIVSAASIKGAAHSSVSAVYADTETRKALERHSVDAVLALLREEFPGEEICELPPNNPGFDIRVGPREAPLRFVEVKGTQSREPVFWMTEGERQFSEANADRYELIVVAGIDLAAAGSHQTHRRRGAVGGPAFHLEPSQWRGRLIATR